MRNEFFITSVIFALSVCEMHDFSEESSESMIDDFMKRYPFHHHDDERMQANDIIES